MAARLNRHFHLNTLLQAYRTTGNPKYVTKIDEQLRDWVTASWPYLGRKGASVLWRGLEVSFRVKSWAHIFYELQEHPALSDTARLLLLCSLPDHAHYLRHFHSGGNWATMELSGLTMVGAAWPEFKQSADSIAYAKSQLTGELERQVYPDGVQTELTSHYHYVALANFEQFADICLAAHVPLPTSFTKRLESMWNYLACSMRPDGNGLLNNDSDKDFNRHRVLKAAATYGREDWRYVADNGRSGREPRAGPSFVFPWAGQLIMRSGYDCDAHWAFFDLGPWGTGHQHNDKLHLSVAAFGRDLLVDSGRFAYSGALAQKFRSRYACHSAGHNVILIDGRGQASNRARADKPLDENAYPRHHRRRTRPRLAAHGTVAEPDGRSGPLMARKRRQSRRFGFATWNRNAFYHVVPQTMADQPTQTHLGTRLMDDGIRVDLLQRFRAAMYVVRKMPQDDVGCWLSQPEPADSNCRQGNHQ